jgi:hypothetical protein
MKPNLALNNSTPQSNPSEQSEQSKMQGHVRDDIDAKKAMGSPVSCFTQVLKFLKFIDVASIIEKAGTDKWRKYLKTAEHLKIMIYAQLAGVSSLRELQQGLEIFRGEVNHIGLNYIPPRSTIAHANETIDWHVFETIYYALLEMVIPLCKESKHGKPNTSFRFNNPVYSIDSTTIDLCYSLFDWAHFRQTKGGIKIHTMLDNRTYLPVWAYVSEAKRHDKKILETLDPVSGLPKGSFVCVDRAYNDYAMLNNWNERGINFVCRAKDGMSYKVLEERSVPKEVGRPPKEPKEKLEPGTYVTNDQIVTLTSPNGMKKYPEKLRIVTAHVVVKPSNKRGNRYMSFITNNHTLAASTITDIYKSRWQIEQFFKDLKSNLRIKTFLGTSPNAVKIQIYTAMITYTLLRRLQAELKVDWSFPYLVAVIRLVLHLHRDLILWLNRKDGNEGWKLFRNTFPRRSSKDSTRNKGEPEVRPVRPGRLF